MLFTLTSFSWVGLDKTMEEGVVCFQRENFVPIHRFLPRGLKDVEETIRLLGVIQF